MIEAFLKLECYAKSTDCFINSGGYGWFVVVAAFVCQFIIGKLNFYLIMQEIHSENFKINSLSHLFGKNFVNLTVYKEITK